MYEDWRRKRCRGACMIIHTNLAVQNPTFLSSSILGGDLTEAESILQSVIRLTMPLLYALGMTCTPIDAAVERLQATNDHGLSPPLLRLLPRYFLLSPQILHVFTASLLDT